MARITATADLVIWDSFEQPDRKTREYTAFGPFQFDRRHYDDALRAERRNRPRRDLIRISTDSAEKLVSDACSSGLIQPNGHG